MCVKNLVVAEQHEQDNPSRYEEIALPDAAESYEIVVKGCLADHWSEWLGDLAIHHDDRGNTRLSGTIADQAALHGILAQIRNLGLSLLSLTFTDKGD